jgi:hypothetical protein
VEHRRPDLVRSRSGPLAARRGPGMSQECQRANRSGSHQRKGTERNFVKQFSDEDDCQTVRTNNKAILRLESPNSYDCSHCIIIVCLYLVWVPVCVHTLSKISEDTRNKHHELQCEPDMTLICQQRVQLSSIYKCPLPVPHNSNCWEIINSLKIIQIVALMTQQIIRFIGWYCGNRDKTKSNFCLLTISDFFLLFCCKY